MADTPVVGGDKNVWGAKLNTFLGVAHETSGANGGMARSAQTIYTPAIGTINTVVQNRLNKISYLSDFASDSLATAITLIGSTSTTLYIDVPTTCSTPIVIPSNIIIVVLKNGIINFAGGNITINSPLYTGMTQIFSGFTNSSVIFKKNSVEEILPQWWGAKGDGVTDDTLSIQAAIETANTSKIPIHFTANMFKHTGIILYSHMVIYGCGRNTLLHNTSITGASNITFNKGSNINITDITMKDITLTGVQLSGHGIYSDENNRTVYSHFENVHVYLCGKESSGWRLLAPSNNTYIRCQGEIGNSETLNLNGTYPAVQYGITIPSDADMHKYGWYIQSSDALLKAPLSLTFINCAIGEGTTRTRGFFVEGTTLYPANHINILGCIAEAGTPGALGINTSVELSHVLNLNISGLFCERNAPAGTVSSAIDHINISNCDAVSLRNVYSMGNINFDTVNGLSLTDSILASYSLTNVTNYVVSNIKKEQNGAPTFALDYLTNFPRGSNYTNNTLFKADSDGVTFTSAVAHNTYRNGWYATLVGGATITQGIIDNKTCIKLTDEASITTASTANMARDGGCVIKIKPNTYYTISCAYKVADANGAYLRVKTYDNTWNIVSIDRASFNNRASGGSYGTNINTTAGVATMVLDSTVLFLDAFTILTAAGTSYMMILVESVFNATLRIKDISINEGLDAYNNNNFCLDNLQGVVYWNPGNILDGDIETKVVTIVGCVLGDIAIASLNINVSGLTLSANITATDTVTCTLTNNTGSPVDLVDAYMSVKVLKK